MALDDDGVFYRCRKCGTPHWFSHAIAALVGLMVPCENCHTILGRSAEEVAFEKFKRDLANNHIPI